MSEPIKEYRFVGTDAVYHDANFGQLYYLKSEVDAVLEEKNKEIKGWKAGYNNLINVDIPRIEANLKKEIENLKSKQGMNESRLKALIVYTPREGVVEGLWKSYSIRIEGVEVYLKSEADKVIAEKDAENSRLKRALWRARSERALTEAERYRTLENGWRMLRGDYEKAKEYSNLATKWDKAEQLCKSKEKEYK